MVKKPNGDGTHKKKARVVVCGNFQQVQPRGRDMCEYTFISHATSTGFSRLTARMVGGKLGCFLQRFCMPHFQKSRRCIVDLRMSLVRLGLVQPGIVWKLKKALYGLRTSPKAWEEERDQKLGQLKWDGPHGKVGLVKVESANCVWMIQALEDKACSNPLGMVIAYVDDIIAMGEQEQLDGMKAELDKLYVMKTSGFIPSTYDPEVEPLRFSGMSYRENTQWSDNNASEELY